MTPIFFPFTSISEPEMEAVLSFFSSVAIYRVSSEEIPVILKEWADEGKLDIRIPLDDDNEQFHSLVKDYRNWASLHQKTGLSWFKTRKGKIPFYDDSNPTKIREEILKKRDQEEDKPDQVMMNARLFLKLAEEYDLKLREVTHEFIKLEDLEKNLMMELKGGEIQDIGKVQENQPSEDHGGHMTSERVRAWALLFSHDDNKKGPIVTTSPAVIDYILDRTTLAEEIASIPSIPIRPENNPESDRWRSALMEFLKKVTESDPHEPIGEHLPSPPVGTDKNTVSLKIYRISGESPEAVFGGLSEIEQLKDIPGTGRSGGQNTSTCICLIDL